MAGVFKIHCRGGRITWGLPWEGGAAQSVPCLNLTGATKERYPFTTSCEYDKSWMACCIERWSTTKFSVPRENKKYQVTYL